jgi:hypothetical protein
MGKKSYIFNSLRTTDLKRLERKPLATVEFEILIPNPYPA